MSENESPVEGAEVAAPVEKTEPQAVTAEPEVIEEQKPKGVQKRIDELTRNWRQAERDRDRLLALLEQQQKPQEATKPIVAQGKPTLEQFQFDQDAYLDALTDWKLEQRLAKQAEEQKQQASKKAEQEQTANLQKRLQTASEKYADFHEVVTNPDLPLPMHVVQAAMELGDGATDVLYFLGKNPAKAAELAQMSPTSAAIALGRIEAQLSKPAPKVEAPAPQVTKAPPPPTVLGNRGPVEKDPEKMTADEWQVWRNKQIAAERQALRRK